MKRSCSALLLSCAVLLGGAPALFAQAPTVTRYWIIDVGPIGGDLSVFRLNQNGAMIWNSNGHAFVYQNCQSRDLGHLAADSLSRATSTTTASSSGSRGKRAGAGARSRTRTA